MTAACLLADRVVLAVPAAPECAEVAAAECVAAVALPAAA